jgi:hypothetical protein
MGMEVNNTSQGCSIGLVSGILLKELGITTKDLKTAGLAVEILNLRPPKHRNPTDLTTTSNANAESVVRVLLSIFGRYYCHFE